MNVIGAIEFQIAADPDAGRNGEVRIEYDLTKFKEVCGSFNCFITSDV